MRKSIIQLGGGYLDYVIRPDGLTSGYSKNDFSLSLITNDFHKRYEPNLILKECVQFSVCVGVCAFEKH